MFPSGNFNLPSSISSTSTTTGTLTVAGGVGISGALNIGNSLFCGNSIGNSYSTPAGGSLISVKNTSSTGYGIVAINNDGSSAFNLFLNGSGRSSDGGANNATIRNDAGSLNL